MFRKLKRVWSHNDMNHIPRFNELFPELSRVSTEELCDRWIELGIDFYTEKKAPVKPLMRLTLPFALILMLLMLIALPVVFLITGDWGYPQTKKSRIFNWFRSLRLI